MTNRKIDNTFIDNFSKEFRDLYSFIRSKGFLLTLVGGGPRDYLLGGVLSKDLDFELRHEKDFSGDDWILRIKELGEELIRCKEYKVEFLPFSILRVAVSDTLLELASPRVEVYDPHPKESVGHKDFKARLSSRLDYSDAFLRRDFTINAIGIELEGMSLIDPYNGVMDLKNMILRPVGEDFFKDPVRFLRMIRFFQRFDLTLTKELDERLKEFDLRSLTNYYFLSEGLKSDFFVFAKHFFETVDRHKILLPPVIEKIGFFRKVVLKGVKISMPLEVIPYLVFREESALAQEEIDAFVHFAALKKKISSNLISFKKTLEGLLDLPVTFEELSELVKEAAVGPRLEGLLEREEFVLIEKFYLSRERLSEIWDVIEKALPEGPLQEICHSCDSIVKNIDRIAQIDSHIDIKNKVSPKLKVRYLIYNQLKKLNT